MLTEWADKYQRIDDEMKRYEKMLETLERLQKQLVTDIWLQFISLAIAFSVLFALIGMIDFIPGAFLYFYVPVLAILSFFTAGRGIILLSQKIARLYHHKRKDLPFQYPKPIVVNSNYPFNIPPNYYTEQLCIEWLMEKYNFEMSQLKKLRKEIEQASEQDYKNLQENLNEIVIYEIIGRAK